MGISPRHPTCASIGVLIISLLVLCATSAFAQQSRELVVVIDVSTSMQDLFDEAKTQAKQFVSSARIGDRVTIITFGERAQLVERSRIRSSYDMARLIALVDELEATEYTTNLPAGMERGLNELKRFYKEDPNNPRIMMWLSDDKENPPDIPDLITFSTLKERERGKLPDQPWFELEKPMESEAETDLEWFVDWISRSKMHLSVELLTDDLGALLAPDLERELRFRFEPSTQAVVDSTFHVVAEVTAQGGKPYSEAIPVYPSEIVCEESAWEETLHVIFPDRTGSYVCRISLVLPSDKLLVISPPQMTLKVKIQPEIKRIHRPVATLEDAVKKSYTEARSVWDSTQRAIALQKRAELHRDTGMTQTRTRLLFGPISARGRYQVTASLTPTRNLAVENLYLEPDFKLPSGLEFSSDFRVTDGKLFADLHVSAAEDLTLKDGWELNGKVLFLSSEKDVKIYPAGVPVKFYAKKGTSRWGRRELETQPTYYQFGKIWTAVKSYMVMAGKGLLALLAVWLVYYVIRRYVFGTTQLVGYLEVVNDPTDHKMKNINLRRMGKIKGANSLTVGSSRKADIVLSHDSPADWHAKITTAKTEAGTVVFAQPLHHNQIFVNDVAYTRRKEIGDKDVISIGDYTFLYRCDEIQRQTIVRFADGRSVRGVLISWDIDNPTFEFLPQGAPSMDARMLIEFSELKAVFFVRKPSRFPLERFFTSDRRPSGRPVEVIFNDGELLEGYMIGEASEWSKRFYLIPKARGEVALVLVEHSAVQNIFMRDAFEKEPLDLLGAFKNLLGRNEY